MIAKILPTFTNEAALIGELIEVDENTRGTMKARLLGNSDYIRNNTDGYVMVERDEIERVEPYKGMPATIHLVSDSMAAVVVRVNAKSVTVARVATDETKRFRINAEAEPFPCYAEPGILTEVIGTPERYSRIEHGDGRVSYRNGSIGLTLGKSVRVTDYRY